jgi:hypothetical protein
MITTAHPKDKTKNIPLTEATMSDPIVTAKTALDSIQTIITELGKSVEYANENASNSNPTLSHKQYLKNFADNVKTQKGKIETELKSLYTVLESVSRPAEEA